MNINPIDSYSVATDNKGVLDTLVRQTYDNTPSEDQGGIHYEEKWKGPYTKIKEVLSHINVGMNITRVRATLGSYIGISEQITYPTCPTRDGIIGVWYLNGIRTEEIDAGAHGNLYLSFNAYYGDDGDDLTDDPFQDTWSINWQSYSVDPYAFCSNNPNQLYPCSPTFEVQPSIALPPASWDKSAMRAHIDQYLNTLPENKSVNGKTYYYFTPDQTQMDSRYFLNDVETAVMKKKTLGRSATYHYPIITHQTVKKGNIELAYDKTLGDSIDHVVDELANCPYSFPAGKWTWVKIGDDMTQTKVKSPKQMTIFTRRETFAGFTDVDMNFYGNEPFNHSEAGILSGRWEIGAL